jgi:hypothetical protein
MVLPHTFASSKFGWLAPLLLAFILLTVYTHTLKYLYNVVHVHVHIFYIFAKRTDTVRTVSSGKTETDQSNVHAHVYVIINTTLGTVI